MNVKIQTVRFDADSRLLDHVNKRIEKLRNLHDRIVTVAVFLKLENMSHSIKDKVAEIKVLVPGHEFFVKHSTKSFEESFDVAFDGLLTQLKRKKEKIYQN